MHSETSCHATHYIFFLDSVGAGVQVVFSGITHGRIHFESKMVLTSCIFSLVNVAQFLASMTLY